MFGTLGPLEGFTFPGRFNMASKNVSGAKRDRFARKWFSEWRPDPPVYGRASQLLDQFKYARPGIEEMPWGTRDMSVKDPFGNRLTFTTAISA
jgi:Glyoxalase superfamily protein